jgi:two-component system osmolarity sensor histidine kinase EnvZ
VSCGLIWILVMTGQVMGKGLTPPVISRLAHSHRLIVPDVPGLGESGPVRRLDADTFDNWFAELLRQTCDDKPMVVAHSLLGSMDARFAARHSDLLRGLVIYAAPGIGRYHMPLGLRAAALRFALRPSQANAERFDRWAFFDFDRARRVDPQWFGAFSDYTRSRATVSHVKRTMRQLVGSCTRQVPDAELRRIAFEKLSLNVDFLPVSDMPPPGPKPFFSLLDQALSQEVRKQIGKPFWIDTVGRSNLVELRIQLDDAVMRVFARRSAAYASNSEIFLLWMVGTSLVLITVAILFLRNQIRPILRLADAVEGFGKGREVPDFRPRGAQEVRRAASAFIEMKSRVERTIEQRTTMLAGVSHDLRTVLTRFKLELALIGDGPEVDAMKKDIDEMSRMLEAYLAFARGDAGEQSEATDMAAFLEELRADAERDGHKAAASFHGYPVVTVRPNAFKRCLANLVSNAARFGSSIEITGQRDHRYLTITVDDDGSGIPAHLREDVFKPFLRLDDVRNQDEGGSGLGLAIARDIARSHGGDIMLGDSPLGGLRATVRVPV